MPNVFDYLSWRADVPFSAAPFNLALLLNGDDAGRDGVSVYQFFKVHKKERSLIFLLLTPLYGRITPSSNDMHLIVRV